MCILVRFVPACSFAQYPTFHLIPPSESSFVLSSRGKNCLVKGSEENFDLLRDTLSIQRNTRVFPEKLASLSTNLCEANELMK